MAQIRLVVNTDLKQAKAAVDTLKTSFADLAKQLSTITVNKNLTAQLNALTKYYDSVANAGARAAQQTRGTAANVETLRKGYANLINQLNTLQKQYASGTFDATRKSIEQNFEAVKKLSQAHEVNGDEVKRLSGEYKKLAADVAQFRAESKKIKSDEPLTPDMGNTLYNTQKQWAALANSIKSIEKYYPKGTFDEINAVISQNRAIVSGLVAEYESGNKTLGTNSVNALQDSSAALKQQKAALEETKNSAQNYHGTLRDIIQGFIKFQLSASIVMNSIQLIRGAFNSLNETLVETEKVVVSIQRVLDETVEGGEISDKLYDIAERLGQTFDNVQEIAQNFAKAGLSWQETLEATEAAVLALNVAELTAEESSEGLIAVMQQFNYEASELVNVIDVLNKAADKSAVDTQELLVALQKTGSYASAANLSLEETVGLISALSEATAASGQNIGNALKSLFSYTTRDSSLDTFASLSDGMNEVVEQYRLGAASILEVWEQLSVEMQSLDAQQADALSQWTESSGLDAELEGELSEIYDSLTGVYDSAGVYRKNYFIALMNNFEEVKEVMGEVSDAQGYTAEEQAKYMDTYEAKLNSLQAQWQHLANDEQGWLSIKKGLVDMASGILTAIDAIGGLRTVVSALATVFASLFGAKIIKGIANIGKGFKNILSPLKNFQRYSQLAAEAQQAQVIATDLQTVADQKNAAAQALKNSADASSTAIQAAETAAVAANTAATEANAVATQKAALASKAFASATNTVIAIAMIAVTVITAVVGAIRNANEKARQAAEERRQAALDNWAEISKESAELAQLSKQYEDLSAVQNKTAEEEETFKTTQEQIIELLGERAKVLGLLTEGTEEYTNKLKELTQEELSRSAKTALSAQNAAQDLDENKKSSFFNAAALQIAQQNQEELQANLEKRYGKEVAQEFSRAINMAREELSKNPSSTSVGTDLFERITNIFLQYIPEENWDEDTYKYFEYVEEAQNEIENRISTAAEAQSLLFMAANGQPRSQSDIDEIVNNVLRITQVGENYRETIEGIVVSFSGYKEAVENATESGEKFAKSISSLNEEELDELITKLEEVRNLEEDSLDLEEKKKSIIEAQNDLIKAQQALEDAKNSRGVYRFNAQTGQFEWVQNEKAIQEAEEEVTSTELKLQDAIDKFNEYIEDQVWEDVLDELDSGNATNESIKKIIDSWKEEAKQVSVSDTSWYQKITDAIKQQSGVDVTQNTPPKAQASTSTSTSSSSSNTSSSASQPSRKPPSKRWTSYEDAVKDGYREIMPLESFQQRGGQVSGGQKYSSYQEYLDAMNKAYGGTFDSGGIARGLGFLPKATSRPESVNDPALTAKILSPTSNAQFDRYVRDMGIMFEQARAYTQAPVLQSTAGSNVVTTTNNSTYINGVKIGSDMMSKPFGEVLQMVSMVPTK